MNKSILLASPTVQMSGISGVNSITLLTSVARNSFYGATQIAGQFDKSSVPNGYLPPYAWLIAPKAGGLGCGTGIQGTADLDEANLAAGKNIEATLAASGDLTGTCSLIVSMLATLAASGSITNAAMYGKLEMVATLAASGDLTATLEALAHLVADINADATMSPEMNATANMEADILPYDELSPQSLAAAVWNAAASAYNESGTMGKKQNDALSLAKFIGLK